MIWAIVTFASLSGPLVTLRSTEPFATHAACAAFLHAEVLGIQRAAADVAAQLGAPVEVRARCVDLRPGVDA